MTFPIFPRMRVQIFLFTLFLLGVPAVSASATENIEMEAAENEHLCDFSKKLRKPFNRVQFLRKLTAIRNEKYNNGDELNRMYNSIIKISLNEREEAELDELSFQCLACHDGVHAAGHQLRFKNVNLKSTAGIDRIHGSHPIGMDYAKYCYKGNTMKRVNELNPDIVLIQGKVGCISCHNPLNPEKRHLVVSNSNSSLCFSCHIK